MEKSTSSRASRKALTPPKKPYPDFPLSPHPTGKWQKKIRKKIYYFGNWARRENNKLVRVEGDGWEAALEEYKKVADDLHAGRTPRAQKDGLSVGDLCNRFLAAKFRKMEAQELTPRMFADYKQLTDLVVKTFGKERLVDDLAADDFATLRATMAKSWGPVRLGVSITRIKSIFKYGYDTSAMDRPVRFGPEFVPPDKSVLRRHRAKSAPKMFEAEELRWLIDGKDVKAEGQSESKRAEPSTNLRAMILLGANCGFGNTDCSGLTLDGLDLDGGWLDFPRPKTGVPRRCPLWPETVAALRAVIDARVAPKDSGCRCVFLTAKGTAYVKISAIEKLEAGAGAKDGAREGLISTKGGAREDLVSRQFKQLLKALSLHRKGVGFYSLRHVFETVGGESKDQVAVDHIMGHADSSMSAHYRERVDDARLRAVANHVRKWLWPDRV
jgi:integrase